MGNQGHSRDEARLGTNTSRPARSATSRKCTSGPTVRSATGRRACRVRRRCRNGSPAQLERHGRRDAPGRRAWRRLSPSPKELSWDLFLGVAPTVDYHPIYHPFNWRGWVDWGQGALGDMGAHLIDHPFWSLKLGMPTVIETIVDAVQRRVLSERDDDLLRVPGARRMPAVKLTWYDGGLLPPRPDEMGEEKLNAEGGVLYIGSKGKMLQDTYGLNPRLLPKSLHDVDAARRPTSSRASPHEEHEMNWVDAIKGKAEISSPFEYAARLTEVMLLGIASLRAGGKIHYDAANMKITTPASGNAVPEPRVSARLVADAVGANT